MSGRFLLTRILAIGGKIEVCNSENSQYMRKRRSRVSSHSWVRFGCGSGSGLELGLGCEDEVRLVLRPYLDPTRKCFLAGNIVQ